MGILCGSISWILAPLLSAVSLGKATGNGSHGWTSDIDTVQQDGVSGSWLQPDPVLPAGSCWGVDQEM